MFSLYMPCTLDLAANPRGCQRIPNYLFQKYKAGKEGSQERTKKGGERKKERKIIKIKEEELHTELKLVIFRDDFILVIQ